MYICGQEQIQKNYLVGQENNFFFISGNRMLQQLFLKTLEVRQNEFFFKELKVRMDKNLND